MTGFHLPTHLREAFGWSSDDTVAAPDVLAAALGMAVPVMLGALAGNIPAGLAAALGSLAIGRARPAGSRRDRLRRLMVLVVLVLLAGLFGVAAGGGSWVGEVTFLVLAGLAATIGGLGPTFAGIVTMFILFLAIIKAVPVFGAGQGLALVGLLALGTLFTLVLRAVFTAVMSRPAESQPQPAKDPASRRERFDAWRSSLARLSGWNYTIRLVAGLAVAAAIARSAPGHDWHWIALTVVLLTPREPEILSVMTTQRAIGTLIGVAFTGLVLGTGLPQWALVPVVAVLAGARTILRSRNYLAYTTVMAPLIILIIDAGQPPDAALLLDRVTGTLIGAALVVVANLAWSPLDRTGKA